MYTCRECERELNQATEVCPYCGTDLSVEPQVGEKRSQKPKFMRTVVRYTVLLAAIWAFLWYVLPERRGADAVKRAEERAITALREAGAALAAYSGAQNGAFPAALEVLSGENAERVRQAAREALAEGYQLEYEAKPAEASGRIPGYTLSARPRNWGYRNFYTDETGIVRATRENRSATAQDTPI